MELSIFVAQLYGITSMVLGLGMLINPKYYKKTFSNMVKDPVFVFTGGVFALIIGTILVLNHNIWEASWVVIISLFGWLGLIKGFMLLAFPKSAEYFGSWFDNKNMIAFMGFGSLILGLILFYFGFFA